MDNKIQSLRAREVQATIDDLNQYLEGNVTAEGLVDTLQDMIKFLNQFIFENKTDNFDLRKYLAEGKLLKEEMSLDAFLKNQLAGIEGETEGMETVEKKEWLDMFGGTKNESGFDDIYNLIKNGKRSHSIDFGDFKYDYSFELGKNKIIIKYKING